MKKLALVRRPGPRVAEGLVTHLERSPVDSDLALRQWQGYVDALHTEGWRTIEVEPADDCPDAVFVEDTVVVYDDVAVISRPGADERKPETAGTGVPSTSSARTWRRSGRSSSAYRWRRCCT